MNQKSLDKNKPIYVSKCCNSEMTVVGDSFGEGTNHYECNECHQPCDFIQLKSSQSLDKKKTKELEWEKTLREALNRQGVQDWTVDYILSLFKEQRTELLEEILNLECLKEEEQDWEKIGYEEACSAESKNELRKEIKEEIKKL